MLGGTYLGEIALGQLGTLVAAGEPRRALITPEPEMRCELTAEDAMRCTLDAQTPMRATITNV
jgi:hypothetical protein